MAVITLTTDFGTRDGYVAAMKGVILRIAPDATIVDASHEVERHNILHGAYLLRQIVDWYPPASIHVAVVDPGVGTARRIVAARSVDQFVIAPDNGLLSLLQHDGRIAEVHLLENPVFMLPRVSATFHGRDVMAPAAAHLAMGASLADVGPLTDRVEVLRLARPDHAADGSCTGCIIHHDRFGNLITNISAHDVGQVVSRRRDAHVYLDDRDLGPPRRTYADVATGEPLALIGSNSHLEIAVNAGNARERLNPGPNTVVRLA